MSYKQFSIHIGLDDFDLRIAHLQYLFNEFCKHCLFDIFESRIVFLQRHQHLLYRQTGVVPLEQLQYLLIILQKKFPFWFIALCFHIIQWISRFLDFSEYLFAIVFSNVQVTADFFNTFILNEIITCNNTFNFLLFFNFVYVIKLLLNSQCDSVEAMF